MIAGMIAVTALMPAIGRHTYYGFSENMTAFGEIAPDEGAAEEGN